MRHESQKSKTQTLASYVEQWQSRVGSRETIAIIVVETHYTLGLDRATGITFPKRHGPKAAKVNADRIFRWVDDLTRMPANFESSILAAMPQDLVLRYLNEIFCSVGFVVRPKTVCVGGEDDPVKIAYGQHKESSEATSAILELCHSNKVDDLERALKETLESIAQAKAAVSYITSRLHAKKYGVSL